MKSQWFLCVLALAVLGCDDTMSGPVGGSGGSAGMGGAAGMGGEDGTGGMGGDAGMPECETVDNCIDDFNQCTANSCTDGACVYAPVEDGEPCDVDNECTAGGACTDGECVATPVTDGTECGDGAGTCHSGSCSGTFACTEAGIREAIAVGGGPHTFDCDGPKTVTVGADIEIDNDVELDGGGNLIIDRRSPPPSPLQMPLSR